MQGACAGGSLPPLPELLRVLPRRRPAATGPSLTGPASCTLPSTAVARKLGLAPQRSSLDARLTKLRGGPVASPAGMATPARGTSLDGILHALQQAGSARSSLDQQAAMLQAMQAQQQLAAAGLAHGQGGMPGAGYPGASNNGYGGQGGAGYGSQPAPDAASLHPALLSLVAAQMQGNGNGGAPAGPARGVPSGMHSGLGAQHGSDANMAALVESLNGWQLNGGGAGMDHRASMEGMSGMAGAPVSAPQTRVVGLCAAGQGRQQSRFWAPALPLTRPPALPGLRPCPAPPHPHLRRRRACRVARPQAARTMMEARRASGAARRQSTTRRGPSPSDP